MQKSRISIIVATDAKRGIGKNNALMWKIKGELPRFKRITIGHPIIMGRKTYESIGRPLPGRTNIIITNNSEFKIQNSLPEGTEAIVVHSLDEAILQAKESEGSDEIFIIGGGQIFTQALPRTDRLYLTIVQGDFGADVFFPEYTMFTKEREREDHKDETYEYSFLTLEK